VDALGGVRVRLKEDAYGSKGWLAGQGTILTETRRQLVAQIDWSDPLKALIVIAAPAQVGQAVRAFLSSSAGS
jgi:hypothetical protein